MDITSLWIDLITKKLVCTVIKYQKSLGYFNKIQKRTKENNDICKFLNIVAIISDRTNYYLIRTATTSNSNNYHFIREI